MNKLFAVLALSVLPLGVFAAPGPFPKILILDEFDLTHEPDIQGGAKSFTQVVEHAQGKPSDPIEYTLDAKGRIVRKVLTGKTTYTSVWRYDGHGDLVEFSTASSSEGKPEKVFKHNVATYAAPGKLSGIACEQALSNPEMEPSATVVAEATSKKLSVKMNDPKDGNTEAEQTLTYGADGRATAVAFKMGSMEGSGTLQRDARGNVIGGSSTVGKRNVSFTVKYTYDAKGNWTKAESSTTVKSSDGKEVVHSETYTRKFVY